MKLEVTNVSIQARHHKIVDDLSMTLEQGELVGLIGPNGSGKSTTMKALLGLVAPTSGVCRIFGKDSLKVDSRNDVGFLPENPYFYKHLTGGETLAFYGRLCGLRGGELKERIEEMLELVELGDARDRRIGGYSKGMLQRIGWVRKHLCAPEQRARGILLVERMDESSRYTAAALADSVSFLTWRLSLQFENLLA